jgi:ABC-type nickel/cobalt efflux system permease component RcnA
MRSRLIAGILLALVGVVWIGQGLGLLRGSSFMVDDLRWALAGAVAVVVGVVLALSAWRSGRRPTS